MRARFARAFVVLTLVALSPALFRAQAKPEEPNFTKEQMRDFLLKAKVVGNKQTTKGVTLPYKLTMQLGDVKHEAGFQAIDEHEMVRVFANGTREMNFVDSYQYNIAAYEVAKLVGLEDMMPVTVKRTWDGKTGSLTWWLPTMMDEDARLKQNVHPPDPEKWNGEMMKMRVFTALVDDTDRNLTNVLIGNDWQLYMIDFTRAFRLLKTIRTPGDIQKCEKGLYAKLQALDIAAVTAATKGYLGKGEVQAMMARRDAIVEHFKKLIAEKGEAAVLY